MKKLCKKTLTGVFILLFAFLFKLSFINAASCSISVLGPSSIVVGQTFKVTVSVPSNAGSWQYVLSYDSSKVKQVNGPSKVVGVTGDSKTSTYTFTSLSSGTAVFKATNASIYDYSSETECFSGSGSLSVNMKSQAEIEASYSKNNNLSSLVVEGAELSPAFNKNTLEYSVTMKPDTTQIKVSATPEDSKSTISGTGDIEVNDGLNKVEIVVTAQHGEKKTYIINVTVEELKPIKVKIDGKTYTIVRKKGLVEDIPQNFTETTIKIKGEDVVAYKNDIAKITLVALKDSKGKIELFMYKDGKYTYFNEAKSSNLNLLILDSKNTPKGYVSVKIKYNGSYINAYKLYNSNSKHYLVYAKNLEDGKDNFYTYDKENNTFQLLDNYQYNLIKYLLLSVICLLTLIIFIIVIKVLKKIFTSKNKKIQKLEKKLNKLKNNLNYNEDYDIDDVDERPTIRKVSDDEYLMPKKSRKERKDIEKNNFNNKPSYRRMTLEEDDY